jgi:DNA repair exonuclease SbcCD ATPase subunit
MIVSTSIKVQELVKQKRLLEKSQEEINDIRETIKGLGQVQYQTDGLRNLYVIIYEDISEANRSKVKVSAKDSIDQLHNSLREFSNVRRQTNTLFGITKNLTRLKADMEVSWKLAAEEMMHPYFDLFNLVQQLPEFSSQNTQLTELKYRLSQYKDAIPKNAQEMRDFKQRFERFKKALSSVEGLTPKIQEFLAKVANGTAVLANMDQEILDWCSQSNRSHVFQIRFKS